MGDAVCALLAGGGYAQFAIASAPLCLPVPDGLSMAEAAAMPETFFTVWHNVFERGRLAAGETLRVEMWRRGEAVQFRTWAVQRKVVVLSHGSARVVG